MRQTKLFDNISHKIFVCVCYGNIQGYSQGKPKKTNIAISLVEQERFL